LPYGNRQAQVPRNARRMLLQAEQKRLAGKTAGGEYRNTEEKK